MTFNKEEQKAYAEGFFDGMRSGFILIHKQCLTTVQALDDTVLKEENKK